MKFNEILPLLLSGKQFILESDNSKHKGPIGAVKLIDGTYVIYKHKVDGVVEWTPTQKQILGEWSEYNENK